MLKVDWGAGGERVAPWGKRARSPPPLEQVHRGSLRQKMKEEMFKHII